MVYTTLETDPLRHGRGEGGRAKAKSVGRVELKDSADDDGYSRTCYCLHHSWLKVAIGFVASGFWSRENTKPSPQG